MAGEAFITRRGGNAFRLVATLTDITPVANSMALATGVIWRIPELANLEDGTYRVHYEQTVLLPGTCNYRSRGFFAFSKTGAEFLNLGGNYSLYRTYDVGYSGVDEFKVYNETPLTEVSIAANKLQLGIKYGYATNNFTSNLCSMRQFDIYKVDDVEYDFTTKGSYVK